MQCGEARHKAGIQIVRITTLHHPSIVLLCTELRLASTGTITNQARVLMGIDIETNNSTYADESDRTDRKNFPPLHGEKIQSGRGPTMNLMRLTAQHRRAIRRNELRPLRNAEGGAVKLQYRFKQRYPEWICFDYSIAHPEGWRSVR